MAFQIAQLAVLGRLLIVSDFGLMTTVMVVIGFAQAFADMGLSNAIIYRRDATKNQLSSLYWLNILGGVILCALVLLAAPVIARFYRDSRLVVLICWAALNFLISPFGQQFQVLLERDFAFKLIAVIESFSMAVGVVLSIILAYAGWGVYALVWGQLATAFLRAGLFASNGWAHSRPGFRFRFDDLRGFLGFGTYQLAERTINYFAGNIDKLLIGRLFGLYAMGYYNVAYTLMVRPKTALNPIVTRVAFPVLSAIKNDDDRLCRGYLRVIRLISFTNFPIYGAMFALAYPLVMVIVGPKWAEAVPILQVLVWIGASQSLGNPINSLLLSKGRADLGFWLNVIVLVLYGAAVWIGSRWGVAGVAWSILACELAVVQPAEYVLRWLLVGMRVGPYTLAFIPSLVNALAASVVCLEFDRLLESQGYGLRLVAGLLVYFVIYGLLAWFFQRPFVVEALRLVQRGGTPSRSEAV